MLIWEFCFRVRLWGKGATQVMRGASHLKFDADGKVNYHRDYWDTGEELYMKLPGLGTADARFAAGAGGLSCPGQATQLSPRRHSTVAERNLRSYEAADGGQEDG